VTTSGRAGCRRVASLRFSRYFISMGVAAVSVCYGESPHLGHWPLCLGARIRCQPRGGLPPLSPRLSIAPLEAAAMGFQGMEEIYRDEWE
jgi:hypothetical protein